MQRTRTGTWTAIAAAAAVFAGCGGGGGDSPLEQADGDVSIGDIVEAGGSDDGDSGDAGDAGEAGAIPGALVAGPVTVAAEPGHAVVTVDGRTIDHTADEMGGAFRCTFSDERVVLEVNSTFGSMTLSADATDGGWIGRFTADSDEGSADDWIQYSAQPFDGELGIDQESSTLSYVGTALRQDRNAMADGDMDTPTVEVTVGVNCGGDAATVDVGGETFEFAVLGADSMTCVVGGPDSVDITLNYLATEDRQLQLDVRPDGDGVIGGVYIIDGDDRWSSVISTASGSADGLTVDGSTVTYTGTFEHTSDGDPDLSEQAEGTAVVTCPA